MHVRGVVLYCVYLFLRIYLHLITYVQTMTRSGICLLKASDQYVCSGDAGGQVRVPSYHVLALDVQCVQRVREVVGAFNTHTVHCAKLNPPPPPPHQFDIRFIFVIFKTIFYNDVVTHKRYIILHKTM